MWCCDTLTNVFTMALSWSVMTLLCFLPLTAGYNVIRRDPFARLSETLVTHQNASCDGDILHMSCPTGTKISLQLVLYGRKAPSDKICPPTNKQPRIYTGYEGFSCTIREVLRTVEELCQGKKSCSILTSPESFGVSGLDSCPGIRKYIEVAYKCHPTSYNSLTICGGERRRLTCEQPGQRLAILSSAFHNVSSGFVHCHVRTDYITAARETDTEEAAVTIKQCEASQVTPALIELCQGGDTCLVRADPLALRAPRCDKLHVALKITFTCMDQHNFLPRYTENSPGEQLTAPSGSLAGPEEGAKEPTDQKELARAKQEPKEGVRVTRPDWQLQLVYHLISQTSQILHFIQSDKWKLVLVVTLSVGLGVSGLLLLIILQLCGLYRSHKSPSPAHQSAPPPVDLDSELVDYDINGHLYTPLPEPKIMKISQEETLPTSFQFSTLTRNKGKSNSLKSTPLDSYLHDPHGQGDQTVRYSTIGRSSRSAKRTPIIESEISGPRSLNTSFENNQLYY